jgi:hypothetical protein
MYKLKFNHVTTYYNTKIKQVSTTRVTKPIGQTTKGPQQSPSLDNQRPTPRVRGFTKPTTKNQKPITKVKEGFPNNKVALLIPSNHMVNLLLYHHCIRDVIPLVVVPFFREGHVPSSFTPRSETKDQPMP